MHGMTEQVAAVVTRPGPHRWLVHVFKVGSTAAVGTFEQRQDHCRTGARRA
jgi:hypothetical protein